MASNAIIELALKTLKCSQKDLASQLQVSAAQISKWKKGDSISYDMDLKLRELTGIEEMDPEFVLLAGTIQDALKWRKLICYLAFLAREGAETGYNTAPLDDSETDSLCRETFSILMRMGMKIPQPFPKELDFDYEAYEIDEADETEEAGEILDKNIYSGLISKIYYALNDVYGFYVAYLSELMDNDNLDLRNDELNEMYCNFLALAATKIEAVPLQQTGHFRKFKQQVTEDFERWVSAVKRQAFQAGVPLGAELMDLVYASADELGHSAEQESLGFNSANLHPDIYINELLVGMRMIHQVLPAILKKLDIKFELDERSLRLP